MSETESCGAPGCSRPAAGTVELRPLCLEHFLTSCYAKLDRCAQQLREQPLEKSTVESMQQFVEESARQATHIAHTVDDLDNLQRARLLDILLWAGELIRRLRRGPRKAASVPIQLRSETPGRLWEEETKTRMLSRHGALVECHHAVQVGENLKVLRLDTRQEAQARVAWQRRKGSGGSEIGIEFTSSVDLWDVD